MFGFDKPWWSKSHWREDRVASAGTKRKPLEKERKSRERSREPKEERRLGSRKWSTSKTRQKEGSGKQTSTGKHKTESKLPLAVGKSKLNANFESPTQKLAL